MMSRHVHVRPHCFILTEACSCRLELPYFAGKVSKNKLVCKNVVALAYYGSYRLLVMGSWSLTGIQKIKHEKCSIFRFHFIIESTDINTAFERWWQKIGKVLCCMFLFAVLGVESAQNLAKCKRWLCMLVQLTNGKSWPEALRLCNSCIVSEHKTKYMLGQGSSNISQPV